MCHSLNNVNYCFQCKTLSTWCVDDVDVVIFPHSVCSCWFNGDASLSFQLHWVHSGSNAILSFHLKTTEQTKCTPAPESSTAPNMSEPMFHLVNLCYPASVIEDTLSQGGLPRVDVSGNPNVSDPLIGIHTRGTCPTVVDEDLWNNLYCW